MNADLLCRVCAGAARARCRRGCASGGAGRGGGWGLVRGGRNQSSSLNITKFYLNTFSFLWIEESYNYPGAISKVRTHEKIKVSCFHEIKKFIFYFIFYNFFVLLSSHEISCKIVDLQID